MGQLSAVEGVENRSLLTATAEIMPCWQVFGDLKRYQNSSYGYRSSSEMGESLNVNSILHHIHT